MTYRHVILATALTLAFACEAVAQEHRHEAAGPAENALVAAVHGLGEPEVFESAFIEASVYIRIEPETFEALERARAEGRRTDEVQIRTWAVEPSPGVKAIAVYLSEEGFNRHHPGHHWMRMPGRKVLMFAQSLGLGLFVTDASGIETAGSHAVTWKPAEVAILLARYEGASSPVATD